MLIYLFLFPGNLWESTIYYWWSQQNRYLPRRIRYEIVTFTLHIINFFKLIIVQLSIFICFQGDVLILSEYHYTSTDSFPIANGWHLPATSLGRSFEQTTLCFSWTNITSVAKHHLARPGPSPNTVVFFQIFSLVILKLLEAFSQVCLVLKDNLYIEELKLRCSNCFDI